MDRQFLNDYYQLEREHWWFQVREKIIIEQVERIYSGQQSLKILNVGAATGRSSEILQPFGKVDSLEYDRPSFEFCRDELNMEIGVLNRCHHIEFNRAPSAGWLPLVKRILVDYDALYSSASASNDNSIRRKRSRN